MDLPAPPTVDQVAGQFTVPMVGLVAQPSLTELGAGTMGSSRNGGPTTLDSASISYTLWRYPHDPDDPRNLLELTEELRRSLAMTPPRPLPEWMLQRRRVAVYPTLWEAVLTTRFRTQERETPESILVHHTNHILRNTCRDERMVGEFPGELDSPLAERHIEHVAVVVDGVQVAGMRIDTDPHVYAVGAFLGDRIATAVISREYLPFVVVELATR